MRGQGRGLGQWGTRMLPSFSSPLPSSLPQVVGAARIASKMSDYTRRAFASRIDVVVPVRPQPTSQAEVRRQGPAPSLADPLPPPPPQVPGFTLGVQMELSPRSHAHPPSSLAAALAWLRGALLPPRIRAVDVFRVASSKIVVESEAALARRGWKKEARTVDQLVTLRVALSGALPACVGGWGGESKDSSAG